MMMIRSQQVPLISNNPSLLHNRMSHILQGLSDTSNLQTLYLADNPQICSKAPKECWVVELQHQHQLHAMKADPLETENIRTIKTSGSAHLARLI